MAPELAGRVAAPAGHARPLRFLQVSTFYPPYSLGGDGVFVYRLAHALADAGHDVDVVHCIDSYRVLHRAEPEGAVPGHRRVRVHGLRSRAGVLSPLVAQQTGRPFLQAGAIRRLLRAGRYDVVHFHNVSLFGPGVLRLPAGDALKLYTKHDYWFVCPTHAMWKFGREACETPQCLQCVLRAGRPPQLWRLTKLLERGSAAVDQFIAPSPYVASLHAARGFRPSFEHLPNFVDRTDADWQRPGPRPQARPYFLFVGRLVPHKGIERLVPLLPRLPEADLLVVGAGPEEGRIRELAGPNPQVKLLGWRPPWDLGPLYAHAVACVVPSRTHEIFPTVVAESLARKTPVVASDAGALPDMMAESGGGLIGRTDEEIYLGMRRLLGDPALGRTLGERGYATFLSRWSADAHLARYFDLLDRVARRKLGRVPWLGEVASAG